MYRTPDMSNSFRGGVHGHAVAAPQRLYPLRYHPEQERLKQSMARFCVVPAGRRSGKTELAKRRLVREALHPHSRFEDPRYFAAAPTRDQAKAIFWGDLKRMIPPPVIERCSESDLMMRLYNGAELWVLGMDRPERAEGRPWDGGVLDEYGNMHPEVWPEHVRPALADRAGWSWLIGVPEGRNHYYDLYQYARSGADPEFDAFTWPSADILPSSEVEAARRQLDDLTFQQEYEASFINFSGRAYYPFLTETHTAPLKYNPRHRLMFCFDFNVEPGVAAVAQEQVLPNGVEGTGIIGEVYIPRNSNTEAVCRKLIADWGKHQGDVYCYGDATGGARGSAQVQGSDWDLIKKTLRPHFGDRVFFHRVQLSNPPERSRINAVNSRLKAADVIRLMVDPVKAPNVVKDFEGVALLEGGSGEIDKKRTPSLTHLTDAIGYYVVVEYPAMGGGKPSVSSLRM